MQLFERLRGWRNEYLKEASCYSAARLLYRAEEHALWSKLSVHAPVNTRNRGEAEKRDFRRTTRKLPPRSPLTDGRLTSCLPRNAPSACASRTWQCQRTPLLLIPDGTEVVALGFFRNVALSYMFRLCGRVDGTEITSDGDDTVLRFVEARLDDEDDATLCAADDVSRLTRCFK